jgi:TolB-like protein/Tfp pilus assembly protein PilF
MSEPLRPFPVPPRPPETQDRLDSWKEIAAHLGREVRTVQGWEKNEGLPVHRHLHARQGSVYAFKSELDAWRQARKIVPEEPAQTPEAGDDAASPGPPASRLALRATLGIAFAVIVTIGGFLLWKSRHTASTGESISSVVVLPFLDLSPRHDQDYFSDGLTEEIIDALSRVPNLRVVARTSAFAFKGKANDVRQIGKQLDVGAVLEGSVRKDGDRLRITAQLNRVSDGTHLWSRTYDRQLRDVFAVQNEISQAIANELRAGQVPRRRATNDLEAYQRYQEGRYFFNQQEPASYLKAIERYRQAIDRDPNFALAYAGLADSYAYLAENFLAAPNDVMPKARAAAQRAVDLDPNSPEAHTSRGMVSLDYDWDRDAAQREFLRAIELNPGSGWAHHWYAHSLETQGRLEEAMKEMRAALALDPLSLVIYWDIGTELITARRYDDALAHLKKGDDLFPNFWLLSWEKAEVYYAKHDLPSVDREIEKMKASHPEMAEVPSFIAILGTFAARGGRRAEARQLLDRLEQLHKTQYVEPFVVIEMVSALGDRERLRVWIQRLVEERSSLYLYLPLSASYFDPSPELDALIAKIGTVKTGNR